MGTHSRGHLSAAKALLLAGAPVAASDLKQLPNPGANDAVQLRADLVAWAANALVQHRTFLNNVLFGMRNGRSASGDPVQLTRVEVVPEAKELIAQMLGIHVGQELGRVRQVGPAIAAIDWAAHDA